MIFRTLLSGHINGKCPSIQILPSKQLFIFAQIQQIVPLVKIKKATVKLVASKKHLRIHFGEKL